MKKVYIKMAIALLAAVAVGYAVNAFIGVFAFFIVGALLSKGSVPENGMRKIMESDDRSTLDELSEDLWLDPVFSDIPGNINNHSDN